MEADFWHNLWNKKEIGWHLEDTNQLLLKYFPRLKLKENNRVFIPLCGKTVDIKWLLENGCRVVGVELNENAIIELFNILSQQPTIIKQDSYKVYKAKNIEVFVGDIFDLNGSLLGTIDAIYDRGAIVALPSDMREKYTKLLQDIAPGVPQLVISFDYDQKLMEGPPFSVDRSLLDRYYFDSYNITLLESLKVDTFGFEIDENIWFLENL